MPEPITRTDRLLERYCSANPMRWLTKVALDYSRIELQILAHLIGDNGILMVHDGIVIPMEAAYGLRPEKEYFDSLRKLAASQEVVFKHPIKIEREYNVGKNWETSSRHYETTLKGRKRRF